MAFEGRTRNGAVFGQGNVVHVVVLYDAPARLSHPWAAIEDLLLCLWATSRVLEEAVDRGLKLPERHALHHTHALS